jgi:CopG antitoxin of type II toxin-antitoxin system
MSMPNTKMKPVPKFHSDDEEREFWATQDSTEFIDWRSAGGRKFPKLKPTLRSIFRRLR